MNRLANESSLYLRQHAANPVDWHPWGEEAISLARKLDRPIFLSVGYSACHWCHVMEHESFENPATAKILNEHFVSIKVDREERPDIDAIYMAAVQALNQGQGGWPMSVFLTPDLHPFYAGTYYPPQDRFGRPGFPRLLLALAEAYRDRRDEVVRTAASLVDHLHERSDLPEDQRPLDLELLHHASRSLLAAHDRQNGGFGSAPKFPHALEIRLALRLWQRFGDEKLLKLAKLSLDKMAQGGIHDHLAGGFHRYSVDERWLVPHFEKMLYDNALLTAAYLDGYQATGDERYREVVESTCDYVLREMTDASGPFYSTQDADSEGVEGKFYVWSREQVFQTLGPESASTFAKVYDVTPHGNWEGHNILNRHRSDEEDARMLGIAVDELKSRLKAGRELLLAERSKRIPPSRDEKILSSWNGLMIAALARAGAILNRADYQRGAERAGQFLLDRLRTADGRLLRTCAVGSPGKLDGTLEDYAFVIDAFVTLYEMTFSPKWLKAAHDLVKVMMEHFGDAASGGFFTTIDGHQDLIVRRKDRFDGSTPSGNAMAVTGLLRLTEHVTDEALRDFAVKSLRAFSLAMSESPLGSGQMLIAVDHWLGPIQQVVIVGPHVDATTVIDAARKPFDPRRVIAFHDPADGATDLPLFEGRKNEAGVTTFLCQGQTCSLPLDRTSALAELAKR